MLMNCGLVYLAPFLAWYSRNERIFPVSYLVMRTLEENLYACFSTFTWISCGVLLGLELILQNLSRSLAFVSFDVKFLYCPLGAMYISFYLTTQHNCIFLCQFLCCWFF